jgi:hypothetical protein
MEWNVETALLFAEKGKSKSGQIPEGDVRLTANSKSELHTRLKIFRGVGSMKKMLQLRYLPTS